ncbi:MAG TPA: hypothetical protein VMH83_08255 [Candidatus Acidoferrum sp.]|nr:hypothetical protein [Candidatus Acidoferrum sp.]
MTVSIVKSLALAVGLGLAASATMAAEATHPDFTGLWTNGPRAPGAAPPVRGAAPSLPLLPKPKARREAFMNLVRESGASSSGSCLGTGMPGSMTGSGGYPMEIIQRPEQVTVLYEAHTELRQFFLGDRQIKQADRVAGRNGYSGAHWEGDTLVVETDNLVEQLDETYPHSENATIVERYHLNGTDAQGRRILAADWVMTDPDFYSEPVKGTKTWLEVPNGHLLPYECNEEIWSAKLNELAKKAGVALP